MTQLRVADINLTPGRSTDPEPRDHHDSAQEWESALEFVPFCGTLEGPR
jgi:hypothetical protein